MSPKQKKTKISPLLLSGIIAGGLFLFLALFSGIFSGNNITMQSYFQNMKSKIFGYEANPRIIVVEIDNTTFNALGFPFDRLNYANAINNLSEANVASIGLDIIFEDPSDKPASDQKFADAITQAGNVLIGFAKTPDGIPRKPLDILADNSRGTGYFNVESVGSVLEVKL